MSAQDTPLDRFITSLLQQLVARRGSDLFLTVGFPPAIKIDGEVHKLSAQPLTEEQTRALVHALMNAHQRAEFERTQECNFALSRPGLARFRANAFVQQGKVGAVLRLIPNELPSIDDLHLPQILKEIALAKRGLAIFVGATGCGKSTSLAAMLDWRNAHTHGHIVTVEDPIEFVHEHKGCIVTQREVGVDTESWEVALKNSLRQAPDVILMGEIRDRETMEHAIAFAETGHLCLATLHANSANQALDRIVDFFPEERHQQVLMDLSLNLRALISQRLLRREDDSGRIAVSEILLNTAYVADLIFQGKVGEIKQVMEKSTEIGMQTFDQALFAAFEAHAISYEEALRNADSVNDLRLRIKLSGQRARAHDLAAGTENLQVL